MLKLLDNQYTVEGVPLLYLAQKYGTPLYVYNAEKIKAQYARLCKAFVNLPLQVRYACKALSNISILKLIASWGAGLDTVSLQEVHLGRMAGFAPHQIIYTPNSVPFEEIQAAVEMGVVINIDSLMMLELFGRFYGQSVPCCIRINPHILAGGNAHLQTGHVNSKFGISIAQLQQIVATVRRYKIKVIGVHAHTGSEIWDNDVFLQEADILYQAALSFADLQFIDFGGGLKVAYRQDDKATDVESLAAKLHDGFRSFCRHYGRALEIWLEPGKFLVSEAGYFLVRVTGLKETGNTVFAGVNSGQNHLLRPMFYNAYHKLVNISNPTGIPKVYTVVGYICETDTLAEGRIIFEINKDDILCFFNTGAYGFSMSSNYNSRLRPAEVLILHQKDYLIRKRESVEDLIRNQVVLDV